MPCTVSATDASRHFVEILDRAIEAKTVTITRRGRPVAQLIPYGRAAMSRACDPAWDRLLATLEDGVDLGGERFDRDALSDR